MKPRLVSFKLCPFVQRSVIVLLHKGIDFDITYIELDHPPEWFKAISPFGKVPLLQVGETALFESAVIMEYLDEITPPSLHPADPLQKAHHRAWFEFASNLFFLQYHLSHAQTEDSFHQQRRALDEALGRLEKQVAGTFFAGPRFHLVDAAFAPFFSRHRLMEEWYPLALLDGRPRLQAWQDAVLSLPAVQQSVVKEFPALLREFIGRGNGYAASRFAPGP